MITMDEFFQTLAEDVKEREEDVTDALADLSRAQETLYRMRYWYDRGILKDTDTALEIYKEILLYPEKSVQECITEELGGDF